MGFLLIEETHKLALDKLRHRNMLGRFIKLCGDYHEGKDLLNETFERLLDINKDDPDEPIKNFDKYFYNCGRNLFYAEYKRKNTQYVKKFNEIYPELLQEAAIVNPAERNEDEKKKSQEVRDFIWGKINQLPSLKRKAFLDYYLGDLSYSQMVEDLHEEGIAITLNALRAMNSRTSNKLKIAVEQRFPNL